MSDARLRRWMLALAGMALPAPTSLPSVFTGRAEREKVGTFGRPAANGSPSAFHDVDRPEQGAADPVVAAQHPVRHREHFATGVPASRRQQHRTAVEHRFDEENCEPAYRWRSCWRRSRTRVALSWARLYGCPTTPCLEPCRKRHRRVAAVRSKPRAFALGVRCWSLGSLPQAESRARRTPEERHTIINRLWPHGPRPQHKQPNTPKTIPSIDAPKCLI